MVDNDDILYESRVFQEYRIRKENGEELNIKNVTKDEMFNMFRIHTNREIAELFDVSDGVVQNRRYKLGVTLKNIALHQAEIAGYKYEVALFRSLGG